IHSAEPHPASPQWGRVSIELADLDDDGSGGHRRNPAKPSGAPEDEHVFRERSAELDDDGAFIVGVPELVLLPWLLVDHRSGLGPAGVLPLHGQGEGVFAGVAAEVGDLNAGGAVGVHPPLREELRDDRRASVGAETVGDVRSLDRHGVLRSAALERLLTRTDRGLFAVAVLALGARAAQRAKCREYRGYNEGAR